MKKLLALALVSVFTLGACASSSERETASTEKSNHYVPVGLDR
jgi:hypothetical protein